MDEVKDNNKFSKILDSAEEVLNNNDRLKKVLKTSVKKASGLKEHLSEFKENLMLSISLVKDWAIGDYREVPKKTMVFIIAALIYFIMPIDIIPDFFFKVGLIDDYAVLTYVFSSFVGDIEKYKIYKENKNKKEDDKEGKDVK